MGQGQITASNQAAADYGQEFASAHQALRADRAVQFNLTPPDPPRQTPQWIKDFRDWLDRVLAPVEDFLKWIGSFIPDVPFLAHLLWVLFAIGVLLLGVLLYMRLRHGEWRLPRREKEELPFIPVEEESWIPEAEPVRGWLEEADRLATQGRFAEAIHHLLLRSIEDIARRRPRLVKPALTSREVAALEGIPPAARQLFSSIVRPVERSLFGGRDVDQAEWDNARSAYADFALARSWKP